MIQSSAGSKRSMADKPWTKHYDNHVQAELFLPDTTLIDLLEIGITLNPGRPAFHFLGRTIKYRELDIYSAKFAAWLQHIGMNTNDVVGLYLPNIPESMIALIGAFRYGCIVTGISPLVSANELQQQLQDANVRVLVMLDTLYEKQLPTIKHHTPELTWIVTLNIGDFAPYYKRIVGKFTGQIPLVQVQPLIGKQHQTFQHILTFFQPKITQPQSTPDSISLIQYTGGTTSLPKGVELTHRNLTANLLQVEHWLDWKMDDTHKLYSGFPFFHIGGLFLGLLAITKGYSQCLIPDPLNISHVCRELAANNISVMAGTPTMYQLMLRSARFRQLDFSNLTLCIAGAAPFSAQAMEQFETVIGKGKVMEVYGMTEASPILAMNPLKGLRKPGSAGLPVTNTEIRIVDMETGERQLPAGEIGELIAQGPQIMQSYRHQPVKTAQTLRQYQHKTWLFTGDAAYMDADGYCFIADRIQDMLLVSGHKIFSQEIENIIYQHPAVGLCAVIGVPDQDWPGTEKVKAVIQLKPECLSANRQDLIKNIINYCQDHTDSHKIPKIVEFIPCMPLTPIGKVDKKSLW